MRDLSTEVTPQRYEDLTGVSKFDYEQRLLRAAQESLKEFMGLTPLDGSVESVALDGETEPWMIVRFRANHCPGRRFAWRFPVWPAIDPRDEYGSPEGRAWLLTVHLEEAINEIDFGSVPPDDDGIEWIFWTS